MLLYIVVAFSMSVLAWSLRNFERATATLDVGTYVSFGFSKRIIRNFLAVRGLRH